MTYAIVGSSNNKEKYGYKVTLNLKKRGFDIIPINSDESEILGIKAYKSLSDINSKKLNKIEMVIFIIPPQITLKILQEVKKLKIKKVWFQPGSESEDSIEYCKEKKIEYTANSCIMLTK